MGFGVKPECIECKSTESAMWRNIELGFICNECHQKHKEEDRQKEEEVSNNKTPSEEIPTPKLTLRKSSRMTRNYKTRQNPYALPKPAVPKGKGRRSMFKKAPMKAPAATATTMTATSVMFRGSYIQVGDIVSLEDASDMTYYAQIRGLIVDSFGEKSAVLTWLVPTQSSADYPTFNPSTYVVGPEEELPRSLESMQFVMHAPSDYYQSRSTHYATLNRPLDMHRPGFIWTRLE